MSSAIVGLGGWLPKTLRLNEAWPASFFREGQRHEDRTFNDIAASEDALSAQILARDLAAEALDPFLGVTRRHVADAEMSSAEAEVRAAQAALTDAGIAGSEVDLVLSQATVPDRLPGNSAPTVAHGVGAKRALAVAVEAACASAVAQLCLARALVDSGQARVVLLTQSNLLSRAFPLLHPAAPGIGDAASAMVVTRSPAPDERPRSHGMRDASPDRLARGDSRVEASAERAETADMRCCLELCSVLAVTHGEHCSAVTFRRGDDDASDLPWWRAGGDFRLGSRAPAGAKLLMRETVAFGATTIRDAAARAEVALEQLGVLASVQPRGFIPGAIAERLGLPRERAVTTYDRIAHVGGCGLVFNLLEARLQGRLSPGTYAALYAQGAGFTRGAAIVRSL